MRTFQSQVWLPARPEELFPFFANASNLQVITPPWLHFEILTSGLIDIKAGVHIDYRIRVHGFPLRWRTLIKQWNPPFEFIDEQVKGPYKRWVHRHTFELHDGGTLARDFVEYQPPFDCITHPLFVRRDIEKIFDFRQQALKEKFQSSKAKTKLSVQI